MSNLRLFFLILLSAFGVGALLVWLGDLLYTAFTGKSASERLAEQAAERLKRLDQPISHVRYFAMWTFNVLILLVFLFGVYLNRRGSVWEMILPCVWIFYSSHSLYQLQIRWHKQQSSGTTNPPADQLSGPAR